MYSHTATQESGVTALARRAVAAAASSYPGRLVQAFAASQATNYASGLAFTAFISMFPLIIGLVAIIGLVVSGPELQTKFITGALALLPEDARTSLISALDGIRKHSGTLGAIGVAGMLWSGSSLFTSMEFALGRMVGARQRGFLRQRAMTAVMTVLFVIVVVATIFLNSAAALVQGIPQLAPVLGLAVWLGFMAATYRLVPNRTYPLRQLWPGVLIAGVLMEGLTLLWPLYAALSHGFTTFGAALALFFLLAAWLYFFAQFTLLGALANRMHAGVPNARGLIAGPEPDSFETEATRAADRYAKRARRSGRAPADDA